jgi:hypothetical protein
MGHTKAWEGVQDVLLLKYVSVENNACQDIANSII